MTKKIQKLILYTIDLLIVSMSLYLLVNFVYRGDFNYEIYSYPIYITGIAIYFFIAYVLELYELNKLVKDRIIFIRTFLVGLFFGIALYIITIFMVNTTVSRYFLFIFLFFTPIFLSLWRLFFVNYRPLHHTKQRVLFIYDSPLKTAGIKTKINLIEGQGIKTGYEVKLLVEADDINNLNRILKRQLLPKIDIIILDIKPNLQYTQLNIFLNHAMFLTNELYHFYSFYQNIYQKISLKEENNIGNLLLQIKHRQPSTTHMIFSAVVTFSLCFFLGLILLILIPFIYLINLIFNKGPLLYTQLRIGLNNKEFKVYKFRTMLVDTDKHIKKSTQKNDPRITPFGKIMRQFRIDEIPQIISVFKGDMQLIGPRPQWRIFVNNLNDLTPCYSLRHLIKPGITGWGQVKFGYCETPNDFLQQLEYDLYYIKHQSVSLDLKILLKTISTILFARGV